MVWRWVRSTDVNRSRCGHILYDAVQYCNSQFVPDQLVPDQFVPDQFFPGDPT